ncbi:hypothetical protein PFISCL1PPCAC_24138, partial [Pristionchus fissidentatus]
NDGEIWNSLCEGFSRALFDGITVNMDLTARNVGGLGLALKTARIDEFRFQLRPFEDPEIGHSFIRLISSRQNPNRSLDHLHYALFSLNGNKFDLAGNFIVSLAEGVESFEIENYTLNGGWERLLTMEHLVKLSESKCRHIGLEN